MTTTTSIPTSQTEPSSRWDAFTLFTVCALAFSVSFGAALVSMAKLLVLIALLVQFWRDGWPTVRTWFRQAPKSVVVIGLAMAWFALTGLWTEAGAKDALLVFLGHGRILWLVAALYLIRTPVRAWTVLTWLAMGQALVLLISWLLWLGVPVPFTKKDYPPEMGIVSSGTLEQPVMTTLLCVLLWHLRDRWVVKLGGRWARLLIGLALALAIANVFLVMTGRTGYLVMLVVIGLSLLMAVPRKFRGLAAFIPLVIAITLFAMSPRFHQRLMQVYDDVTQYQSGQIMTSQGLRLEMWRTAIEAARDKPLLGHGVGSYPNVYRTYQGRDPNGASQPHQQYLFWLVEGGLVGLMLLLAFFVSLLLDAQRLSRHAMDALICATVVASVMSLANGPFFGVGMGEFFLVMMAGLIGTRARSPA